MVPVAGLEPARVSPTDFESVASANFTTPAFVRKKYYNTLLLKNQGFCKKIYKFFTDFYNLAIFIKFMGGKNEI